MKIFIPLIMLLGLLSGCTASVGVPASETRTTYVSSTAPVVRPVPTRTYTTVSAPESVRTSVTSY